MNKTNGLILILIVLTVLGFGMFFLNQLRLAEKEAIMEEQLATFDQQQKLLLEAQMNMQAKYEADLEAARQAEAEAKQELARVRKELEIARAALAAGDSVAP